MRFLREPVALLGVTLNTGADYVFPGGRSAAIARHDVIEVQIAPVKGVTAVLAGVLIPLEYVVPRKFHFFLRKPIEKEQDDHARHPNFPRDGSYRLVLGCRGREIAPALKVVGEEIVRAISRNDMRMASVNQRKRASRCADIHRLPEAIENQNLAVEQ
jgi:hypothetical protein